MNQRGSRYKLDNMELKRMLRAVGSDRRIALLHQFKIDLHRLGVGEKRVLLGLRQLMSSFPKVVLEPLQLEDLENTKGRVRRGEKSERKQKKKWLRLRQCSTSSSEGRGEIGNTGSTICESYERNDRYNDNNNDGKRHIEHGMRANTREEPNERKASSEERCCTSLTDTPLRRKVQENVKPMKQSLSIRICKNPVSGELTVRGDRRTSLGDSTSEKKRSRLTSLSSESCDQDSGSPRSNGTRDDGEEQAPSIARKSSGHYGGGRSNSLEKSLSKDRDGSVEKSCGHGRRHSHHSRVKMGKEKRREERKLREKESRKDKEGSDIRVEESIVSPRSSSGHRDSNHRKRRRTDESREGRHSRSKSSSLKRSKSSESASGSSRSRKSGKHGSNPNGIKWVLHRIEETPPQPTSEGLAARFKKMLRDLELEKKIKALFGEEADSPSEETIVREAPAEKLPCGEKKLSMDAVVQPKRTKHHGRKSANIDQSLLSESALSPGELSRYLPDSHLTANDMKSVSCEKSLAQPDTVARGCRSSPFEEEAIVDDQSSIEEPDNDDMSRMTTPTRDLKCVSERQPEVQSRPEEQISCPVKCYEIAFHGNSYKLVEISKNTEHQPGSTDTVSRTATSLNRELEITPVPSSITARSDEKYTAMIPEDLSQCTTSPNQSNFASGHDSPSAVRPPISAFAYSYQDFLLTEFHGRGGGRDACQNNNNNVIKHPSASVIGPEKADLSKPLDLSPQSRRSERSCHRVPEMILKPQPRVGQQLRLENQRGEEYLQKDRRKEVIDRKEIGAKGRDQTQEAGDIQTRREELSEGPRGNRASPIGRLRVLQPWELGSKWSSLPVTISTSVSEVCDENGQSHQDVIARLVENIFAALTRKREVLKFFEEAGALGTTCDPDISSVTERLLQVREDLAYLKQRVSSRSQMFVIINAGLQNRTPQGSVFFTAEEIMSTVECAENLPRAVEGAGREKMHENRRGNDSDITNDECSSKKSASDCPRVELRNEPVIRYVEKMNQRICHAGTGVSQPPVKSLEGGHKNACEVTTTTVSPATVSVEGFILSEMSKAISNLNEGEDDTTASVKPALTILRKSAIQLADPGTGKTGVDRPARDQIRCEAKQPNECASKPSVSMVDLTNSEQSMNLCDSSSDRTVQSDPVPRLNSKGIHEQPNHVASVPSISEVQTISREEFEGIASEEDDDDAPTELCLCCTDRSTIACGRCAWAYYCSKDCQEKHWAAKHYLECVERPGVLCLK